MDPETPSGTPRLSPRLVLGLAVMALGLILTLDSLGVARADDWLRFWPVALIAVGVAKLLQPPDCVGRGSWFVWVFGGLILLGHNLGYVALEKVWPILIFLLGLRIVWRAGLPRVRSPRAGGRRGERGEGWRAYGEAPGDKIRDDVVAGARRRSPGRGSGMDAFAFMGGVRRAPDTIDATRGQAVAVMGGCELDLRAAQPPGGEFALETFAFWGGIEVWVPEDWEVVNRGLAIMGAFEDKTRHPMEPKARLVVTGAAIMGGVEISHG